MSTALGVIAQSNTSTYIVGGLDTYITDNGGSKTVDCYFYYRRTNTYSGTTYSSSVDATVNIDGTTASAHYAPSIPGYNNNWIGPYVHAQKTFTGAAKTITISWSATDNVGGYFGGSGSAQITVPASYTAPTGLAVSNATTTKDSLTATVSVTGWGTGGSRERHYLELSLCNGQSASNRKYKKYYPGDATSATITIDNNAPYTQGTAFTVTPNSRYYMTMYATNGDAGTGNTSFTVAYTKPGDITASVVNVGENFVTISYSTPADGNYDEKRIVGSCEDIWQYAQILDTVNTGSAYTSTITISSLTPDTEYSIDLFANTVNAGDGNSTTLTFKTLKQYKGYGSVNGQTKKIEKVYGSVSGQSKEVKKIYGSVNGVTKRIY